MTEEGGYESALADEVPRSYRALREKTGRAGALHEPSHLEAAMLEERLACEQAKQLCIASTMWQL